jgi:diacylglycerol kinase (ATP)
VAREITLVVNPAAGRGRAARAAETAVRALRDAGLRVRTAAGADAGEMHALARDAVARGTAALIVVGGDGTVQQALQAVAGTDTPLGIVAAGTGNDFARAGGLPVNEPAAAGRLAALALRENRIRRVDLGRWDDRWFATVLATGFDARAGLRGDRMRWPRGRAKFQRAVLMEAAVLRAIPYRIRLDGGPPREIRAVLVSVGNAPTYAGGLRICPGARIDDGLLDITVVGECSRWTLLRLVPRVFLGTHVNHPVVTVHRAAEITLEADPFTGIADGEPVGPSPVTVRAVPGAVGLLVPPGKRPASCRSGPVGS